MCESREEAIARLETLEPQRVFTWEEDARGRPVSFLLPGVGDHYAGMARGLYETEAVFREHLDHCCALLQPLLEGRDLRALLFPAGAGAETGGRVDLRRLCGRGPAGEGDAAWERPGVAQPAVFAIEYALAQLLLGWGLRPQALLGYSLGEYVAACLAGVFTLEQALTLVAHRARLIEEAEPGAMLAVALGPTQLAPRLRGGAGVGLAAINGPALCVVAGEVAGIAALEEALAREEIVCRRLPTTHAYHSPQMDAVQQAYTAVVSGMALQGPQIPVVSNVTGTWLTAADATDPAYWGRHLRQTVQFAEGLGTLLQGVEGALLEVGPGQLGSMVRQHPAWSAARVVLPTLRAAYDAQSDAGLLLTTLGKLWLAGVDIDWAGFQAGARRRRVPLPTYPFERQRDWIQPRTPRPLNETHALPGSTADKQPFSDWFHTVSWAASPLEEKPRAESRSWILFLDAGGVGSTLARRLRAAGEQVTAVTIGDAFTEHAPGEFTIDPTRGEDYQALLRHVAGNSLNLVHLWMADTPRSAEGCLDTGFYSLMHLAQAIGAGASSANLWIVASNMQHVREGDQLHAEKATVLGPAKLIPVEYSNIACRSVDIDLSCTTRDIAADQLFARSFGPGGSYHRVSRRWPIRRAHHASGPHRAWLEPGSDAAQTGCLRHHRRIGGARPRPRGAPGDDGSSEARAREPQGSSGARGRSDHDAGSDDGAGAQGAHDSANPQSRVGRLRRERRHLHRGGCTPRRAVHDRSLRRNPRRLPCGRCARKRADSAQVTTHGRRGSGAEGSRHADARCRVSVLPAGLRRPVFIRLRHYRRRSGSG